MTDVTDTIQPDTPATPETADADEESAGGESPGPTGDTGDRLVPVTEAIRYRKRAQAAEQRLNELNERLEQLQGELGEAHQTVEHLERRQQIDALLAEADAIDIEAARLLTERAVEQMSEPDVQLAVADLRRTRPYLFRHRSTDGSGAMAARFGSTDSPPAVAEQAAQRAVTSGDRRDLLDYLRLRRPK